MKKQSGISYILSLAGGGRGLLSAGVILAIIGAALSYVPYYVIYQIIRGLYLGGLTAQEITRWALIAIGAAVLKSLCSAGAGICSHTVAFDTLHAVRLRVLDHLSGLPLGYFSEHAAGKIKTAIFDDIGRLETFLAHNVLELAQSLSVPIILFVVMLFIHPVMALCMLIPIALGLGIPMKMMGAYPELTEQYARTISDLNASVNEYVSCMPVIKMYNLTADKFQQYKTALSAYIQCFQKMSEVSCRPLAITVVILDAGILFTLPVGGFLYLNGSLTITDYLMFILLTVCFYSAFFSVVNIMMGGMELESGLRSVREIMESEPVSTGSQELPKTGHYGIEFQDVSFSYNSGDDSGGAEALRHLNLNLRPDTVTAFVGTSGAGKTTAAQLIGRYWNTSDGIITIGGVPINDITTESLMDLTAFVFQDVFLLEDTLMENIRMGNSCSEDQVIEAAKAAQIHDFITGLPDGYETRIGDAGVKLSGGEKQRISIARAILKDAPIVIFDEATSYTDIENEHKIQTALDQLLKGRTTIMIAHRLHTITHADNIVVFEHGTAAEQGRHEELIARNGIYADMWRTYTSTSQKGGRTNA